MNLLQWPKKWVLRWCPVPPPAVFLGLPDDAFTDGIMSQAGAAYFLAQARESKTTLFI